ncbi:MAG: GTP-binding protein [Clostridiales bacterium]|nr:GTP-binding protein [Clostridiales bacterium]
MTKIILVTGFLGSGKTTFMKSLLDAYQDKKVGVIVNEFGEANVDAITLEKEGIIIEELTNGSIFCACIKDNFLHSLILLSEKDLEYVFIEASGLSDPSNIGQILETIKPRTVKPYFYKGAICIVDADSFLDLYDTLLALERQIQYSGAVIVNKADLVDQETIDETIEKIRLFNNNVPIYVTSYCVVDIQKIVENLIDTDETPRETSNTIDSRPKTFTLKSDTTLSYDNLVKFLNAISESTFRIKGFLETDKGQVLVDAVGNNVDIKPWDKKVDEHELVVISSVGMRIISLLTNQLDKHFNDQLYLV